MGMFDYVNYKAPCPNCGVELNRWQTKDDCCCLTMLEPWQVKYFYAICGNCGTWIDATVEAEIEYIVKSCDVTLKVKTMGEKTENARKLYGDKGIKELDVIEVAYDKNGDICACAAKDIPPPTKCYGGIR